jgi:Mg-chelatase subunit ChlD
VLNQGKVKKRGGRTKLYALGVSIFVHAAAAAIFGVVEFSQSSENIQQGAAVSISQAKQLMQTPAVVPKPKIISENRPAAKTEANLKSQISNFKQFTNLNYQTTPSDEIKIEPAALSSSETQTSQVEFFGSVAKGRRICYVVDCSGSMQGLWRRVRGELIESIGRLEADQYFCVIAYGGGEVRESGDGKIVRASKRAKKEAYDFVDSLRPAGTTNALDALQRAAKVRDDTGTGPAVIYFLTDGFELNERDSGGFAHQVMTIMRSFSPKTQINTIGFWPGEQDRRTLERIAKDSGGAFVIVNDGDVSARVAGVDDE